MACTTGVCGGLNELANYGRVIVDGKPDDWWVALDSPVFGEIACTGSTVDAALDAVWTALRHSAAFNRPTNPER